MRSLLLESLSDDDPEELSELLDWLSEFDDELLLLSSLFSADELPLSWLLEEFPDCLYESREFFADSLAPELLELSEPELLELSESELLELLLS